MNKKLTLKREVVKKLIPIKTDIQAGGTTAITCTCASTVSRNTACAAC